MRDPRIDEYLHKMAQLYQNLGIESTDEERIRAKQEECVYIGKIAQIDWEYAKRLDYE